MPEVKRFSGNGRMAQELVAKRLLPEKEWDLENGIALVGDQGEKGSRKVLAQENIQVISLRIGKEFGKDMLGLRVGSGAQFQIVGIETVEEIDTKRMGLICGIKENDVFF